jgi:hypothetical protein
LVETYCAIIEKIIADAPQRGKTSKLPAKIREIRKATEA